MMAKFFIAAIASLALFTNPAQGAACTKGLDACQDAITFTLLNEEIYCCLNHARATGTTKRINGVTKTVCECTNEVTDDVADCHVGNALCPDAGKLIFFDENPYCCDFDDDTITADRINGVLECRCIGTTSSIPPEPEVPQTGTPCCEGTAACAAATSFSTVNDKTFCCPGGGSILVQSMNGQEYCTCFEEQPPGCQFANVLDKSLIGGSGTGFPVGGTSGTCSQRTAAVVLSAAAASVAATAGVQV